MAKGRGRGKGGGEGAGKALSYLPLTWSTDSLWQQMYRIEAYIL